MTRIVLGTSGNRKLRIDTERLVDTRLLVQANSGGGKSWCLRRILEQTHGQLQHLVIDLEGEFSSLREKYDYVYAAKAGGDTAAEPRAASLLAERLLELGVSAILDIYELKAHQRVDFVKRFLEALVDAPKRLWHPALVVVDEAHLFCPEKGSAESQGAVIDLATRGRKRGYCALLATQRLAKLHKDAAAECNNKLIGRTGLDVDLRRASDELGFGKDSWPQLRRLGEGEFFAFGPAISPEVVRVKVGSVDTTHPKAGARLTYSPPAPTAKVKKLLPQLADLPAEAEHRQRTAAELQKRIRELERELRKKPAPAPPPQPEVVEVPVLRKDDVARLEASVSTIGKYSEDLRGELGALSSTLAEIGEAIAKAGRNGRPQPARMENVRGKYQSNTDPAISPRRRNSTSPEVANREVPPVSQRILDALAELEAIGVHRPQRVQVAFLAGYSNLSSKGFVNAIGALNSSGYIRYPERGRVELTEGGRALATHREMPRTAEELQERVLELLKATHGRVLRPLLDAYPGPLGREELAARAGYTNLSSKGFVNAIGRLRSLGFIDYPERGQVAAQPVLFLEEP